MNPPVGFLPPKGGVPAQPGRGESEVLFRLRTSEIVNVMSRPRHTPLAGERARSLRLEMTVSEARVWQILKNGQCGARFRRQVPFGPWIVDFCAFHPRLVIEIDDPTHAWRDETERSAFIEASGFPMLRLTNHFVAQDLVAVYGTIRYWVEELKQGRRPR